MIVNTLKDVRDQVLSALDEAGNTGNLKTNINYAINSAQQARLSGRKWPFLRWSSPQTINTVASTRLYALHPELGMLEYLYNVTRKAYMVEVPERNIENLGVWNRDYDHRYFRLGEIWQVNAQPSAASAISVVSTSASDTTQTLTVRGDVSGNLMNETITLTGTSTATGSRSFSKILGLTLSAVGAGDISVKAGAATLVTIPIGELGRAYKTIELITLPTAAEELEYMFYRQPRVLSADNDMIEIPNPHGGLLVWDTLLLMAGYVTDLSKASLEVWRNMQQRAESAFEQEWLNPQTRGAQPRYVRNLDTLPSTGVAWFGTAVG